MNQQEWEHEAYAEGMDKFFNQEKLDQFAGKMDTTSVGSEVLRKNVLDIGAALTVQAAKKSAGLGGSYVVALRLAATRHNGEEFYQDYNIPAYIGMITILQYMYGKNQKDRSVASLAVEIGRRLEYDQQLYVFRQDNQAFVGVIETSLAKQGVQSLRHKLKTYQKKWRDAEMKWSSWGTVKRTHVGMRVIRSVLETLPQWFRRERLHDGRHLRYYLTTTLEFDDFVTDEMDMLSKTMPSMRPMIEPPLDWERHDKQVTGGFHTGALRMKCPFIKTKGEEHQAFVDTAYPYKHMRAVNHMQKTSWKINTKVLDALRTYVRNGIQFDVLPRLKRLEVPMFPGENAPAEDIAHWMEDAKRIHALNKKNTNDMTVLSQSLAMADRLGDRPFWFTYTCDFRGRIYCTSTMLSPQGPDHIKGLLQFATGKPLGRSGIKWLAINGANKYGYDKVNYNDRIQWVIDQRQHIQEVVSNPNSGRARSFLANADKPFQFLAFCYEWEACAFGSDADAEGHLPVGLDGSCNGLQHYAALLRDTQGGEAVNLTGAAVPADIYQDVALEFLQRLPRDDLGVKFHAIGPDRKLAKRPVMTLPYGSTQQSCRAYIREYIGDNALQFQLVDNDREQWKLALYATPYMWVAIESTVTAARAAMKWLQESVAKVSKLGIHAHWLSPADFPVYQHYSNYDTVKVRTDLFGRMDLNLQGDATGVNKRRSRNGVAPNFIHALDSSHMVSTIIELAGRGITDLSMIHDDFGCHACDAEQLFDTIRITFVRMYCQKDWLLAWKMEIERLDDRIELDDPPTLGDLDILDVLDSDFFFG